jgi:hypothetical protein
LSIRLPRNPSYYDFTLKPVPQYNSTMKFTSTTVAILSAMIVKTAFARINYGFATYSKDNHQDHAIWIDGEDACHYVYLGPISENPCSYNDGCFTLSGDDYKMSGCGTESFKIDYAAADLVALPTYDLQTPISGCSNSDQAFTVEAQWYFD